MSEYLPGNEIMPGWEVVRLIGGGGSGKVYEARKKDEEGGHYVSAIKVISVPGSPDEYGQYLDDGYDDEAIQAIFRSQVDGIASEFVMMSQFKGMTNIVSYEDHAIIPHPDKRGWDVAIRMELLTSLTELLKTRGLSEKEIVQLGIDICTALELCTKQNIIHRDIKPQNVFINNFGNFKLGDFGVAKAMERPSHATRVGTSGYMAPEVFNNQTCDARIDQYSLGLMMYWLLNERRLPFLPLPPAIESPTQRGEALDRRLNGEAIPLPAHGGETLKDVVMKACAFNPDDRYRNPTEMKYALFAAMGDADEVPLVFGTYRDGGDAGMTSTETMTSGGVVVVSGAAPAETVPENEDNEYEQDYEGDKTLGAFAFGGAAARSAERADEEHREAEEETDQDYEGDKTLGAFAFGVAAAERAAAERAAAERAAAERAAAERAAAERAAAERAAAERAAAERAAAERAAAERAAAERAAAERAAAERAAAERAAAERAAAERAAAERAAAERAAAERRAAEERAAAEQQNRFENNVSDEEENDSEKTMGAFGYYTHRENTAGSSEKADEETSSDRIEEEDLSDREKTMSAFALSHSGNKKEKTEYRQPEPKAEPEPRSQPQPRSQPESIPQTESVPSPFSSANAVKEPAPEKKKKKTGWKWIILLLILLLLAGGAYYVYSNYDDILTKLPIKSVEVAGMPEKTVYFAGDELDFTGLTLTAKHLGILPETIDSGYSCSPSSFTEAGRQTVTVEYEGQSTSYQVDIVAVVPESLTMKTLPQKTEYFIGDNLDTNGLSVTAKYNNGKTATITDGLTCTPSSFSSDGEQTVTVSWSGITTSFKVSVSKAKVKSIEIASLPAKRNYVAGDDIDVSGLTLTAYYDNGEVKTVNNGFTYSPESFPAAGRQTVTVTYGDKTVEYDVTVDPVKATSITIRNYPKQIYFEGDKLDTSNLFLHVEYNNHTSKDVSSGFQCTPNNSTTLTTSVNTITVSYEGLTTTFGVTVKKVELTGIKVKNKPNKTSYFESDTLNTAGMTLELTYNNGTVQTFSNTNYNCSPTKLSGSGTKTITVTYQGFTATFTVSVTALKVTSVQLVSKPSKTTYYTGDRLDTTGMKLRVTYNNGYTFEATNGFTVTTNQSQPFQSRGTVKVTVAYGGCSTSFDVTVNTLTSMIKLDTSNVKKSYKVGEKLDLSGLVVTLRRNNGTSEAVQLSQCTYTPTAAFTKADKGKTITVTVKYEGLTATFTVSVS